MTTMCLRISCTGLNLILLDLIPELKKAGSTGSRLMEHFHILAISRNIKCQILRVMSRFYIHNWNMVQSQDIKALFCSMEQLKSLLKMFRKHYLFINFYGT